MFAKQFLNLFFDSNKGEVTDAVAEALLWRDESPSAGAVPSPFQEQPRDIQERYREDAIYIIDFVKRKVLPNTDE